MSTLRSFIAEMMQTSRHAHAQVNHLGLRTCDWTQRLKPLPTTRTITLGSYRFHWIGGLAPRLGSYRFPWIGGLAPRHSSLQRRRRRSRCLGSYRFPRIGGLAPRHHQAVTASMDWRACTCASPSTSRDVALPGSGQWPLHQQRQCQRRAAGLRPAFQTRSG